MRYLISKDKRAIKKCLLIFNEKIVAEIDEIAEAKGVSRNRLVNEAVREWLVNKRKSDIEESDEFKQIIASANERIIELHSRR